MYGLTDDEIAAIREGEFDGFAPAEKALLRMAVVWNIPIACNRASADFMISSPLMDGEYDRLVPDYDDYASRKIDLGEKSS